MKEHFKPESSPQIDNVFHEEKYKELDAKLFGFKKTIQLEVFKRLSENDEIKKAAQGKASKLESSASDFDTLIFTMADKYSLLMREKIYNFLLSAVLNSDSPDDLLELDDKRLDDMIDDAKKEQLISDLTNEVKELIISKEEPSLAA